MEAVTNAANFDLAHEDGIAAIIVKKGGEIINYESRKWIENKRMVVPG